MRFLLYVALLLAAALPAPAADDAKPNTLTAKEVTDGWLLLFDGDATFGWQIEGEAKVDKGLLILGGTKDTTATFTTQFGYGNLQFGALTDDANDACLTFNAYKKRPFIQVAPPREKGWHRFHAQVEPDDLSLWARGSKGFGIQGTFQQPTAIALHVQAGQKLLLRDIKFRPRRLAPIFNGKDLTGWKEIKTAKTRSKFSVNDRGELNIKSGPGDLQTEGQWADFVLQIDCLSNGDRLNSGVFFRCQPDKYQQGYEAQIHNGFLAKPKEYKLEEYDPVTHQKTGDKMVKYTAMDYGTGAIYRRQPARFQVAKDYEWFTMTIVAQGRHMAVWVNGIEVTDWTDNRPLSDNARNGCRLEKGPISLQGHDPTTDLSFRNIRVAALPKPAATE